MFVSIYGISSKAVRQAQLMEASQARVTQDMIRENQRSKGVKLVLIKQLMMQKRTNLLLKKDLKKVKLKPRINPMLLKNQQAQIQNLVEVQKAASKVLVLALVHSNK